MWAYAAYWLTCPDGCCFSKSTSSQLRLDKSASFHLFIPSKLQRRVLGDMHMHMHMQLQRRSKGLEALKYREAPQLLKVVTIATWPFAYDHLCHYCIPGSRPVTGPCLLDLLKTLDTATWPFFDLPGEIAIVGVGTVPCASLSDVMSAPASPNSVRNAASMAAC